MKTKNVALATSLNKYKVNVCIHNFILNELLQYFK